MSIYADKLKIKSIVDTTSYLAYLESQLERTAKACLGINLCHERLTEHESKLHQFDRSLKAVTDSHADSADETAKVLKRLEGVEKNIKTRAEAEGAREDSYDAKLKALVSQTEQKLEDAVSDAHNAMQANAHQVHLNLEEQCHEVHLSLADRITRLETLASELQRKVRSVDAYAHHTNVDQRVGSFDCRIAGLEESMKILVSNDVGVKQAVRDVEGAVSQLKAAVVALGLKGGEAPTSTFNTKTATASAVQRPAVTAAPIQNPQTHSLYTTTNEPSTVGSALEEVQAALRRLDKYRNDAAAFKMQPPIIAAAVPPPQPLPPAKITSTCSRSIVKVCTERSTQPRAGREGMKQETVDNDLKKRRARLDALYSKLKSSSG